MIRYLASRPKLLSEICYLGVLLIVTSAFISYSGNVPGAQALACTGPAPAVPAGSSYATTWKVNSWLAFDNVPIGPSGWSVAGHTKTTSGDICYNESWKLTKVVYSQSRDPLQGMILAPDGSGSASTGKTNDDATHTLHFYQPVTEYSKSYTTACGAFGFIACSPTTYNYTQDAIFDGANNGTWNPLGSYGLLRNSSGNLNQSRGYLPKEWQINGTF